MSADTVESLRAQLAEEREAREAAEGRVRELEAQLEAAKPEPVVYCKHCPFSRHVHYERDGKLVTPTCSGFEPMDAPDQGKGH